MGKKKKYSLYLASGIKLWREEFRTIYSPHFNRKIELFEPGNMDTPKDHRKISIRVACHDLNRVNHSDALLVYMKYYETDDGSPSGTDSTWECGYAIANGKPVIMIIDDLEQMHYYAYQWMVAYSINAILTENPEVAEAVRNHQKFVHTTVLLAQNADQFESKITEYLDNYYRSIYSREGIINYRVDERARDLFKRGMLESMVFSGSSPDKNVTREISEIRGLGLESDEESLAVCKAERGISRYLKGRISEGLIDSAISSVVKEWGAQKGRIIDCLAHSIKPPFEKIKGRKQGVKKTRPELFFELYDLVTHHLTKEKRFIKSESFPYDMGAVIELYNWMNTYALDDVFDNSETRQNLETVWKRFSRKDSIYTGILGHLLSIKYIFQVADENKRVAVTLAGIINEYNFIMYTGQVLDIAITFDSEEKKKKLKRLPHEDLFLTYCQRIYGICGGFYESIGELSSKAGNKEEQITNSSEVDRISPLVGMYYGLIQMIRNDMGDYIMPEDLPATSKGMKDVSHSDVEEGKADIAYMASIFSDNITKKEKEFLFRSLGRKLSRRERMKINRILWKTGSIEMVIDLIEEITEHVKSNLFVEYHETPTRTKWMFYLIEITKEILVPFKKQARENHWPKYEYNPKVLQIFRECLLGFENQSKEQRLSKSGIDDII